MKYGHLLILLIAIIALCELSKVSNTPTTVNPIIKNIPQLDPPKPVIKNNELRDLTIEVNSLGRAIDSESYIIDTMYKNTIKKARK